LTAELRQSEIISNLIQYEVNSETTQAPGRKHDYAIVIMQDCDLLWDRERRNEGKPGTLNGILLYEAESLEQFRLKLPKGSDIWKRIRQNSDERYHVLEAAPPEQDTLGSGIPELAIDFKRLFTMSVEEIERQLASSDQATRRCRLLAPYREHLQARAAFYLQRVMLPLPHNIG
jgi:hypothetical protein